MTINRNEQPNYTDILYLIQERDPDMPLNEKRLKPAWDGYGFLNKNKDTLIALFNLRYQFREIGAETVERWFRLVNKRFAEIARFYNHAFKVMEENVDRLDELGKEIITETIWGSGIKDTFQDTPVTPITTEKYASTIDERVRSGKDTETRKDNSDMYIKEINDLINQYNDLVLKWVNEFESCFMSTIMRV